eukprot:TRINITY_DN3042_c0_g1_i6.p1 TRINITY_DN3042_c0_g1~~TRINITY_DN3042_c0_g1_i6.p1  ORF type:complete len:154 (-),score=19.04 TRINITY_DN3042_c0_g1_i6:258-719(-)
MYQSVPPPEVSGTKKKLLTVFGIISLLLTTVLFFLTLGPGPIALLPFKVLAVADALAIAFACCGPRLKILHLVVQVLGSFAIGVNLYFTIVMLIAVIHLPVGLLIVIFVFYLLETSSLIVCNVLSYLEIVKLWKGSNTANSLAPTYQPPGKAY